MNTKFSINGVDVGIGCKPYLIAEISGNHNQHLESAKALILVAKQAGADAVKIQTYLPDTITLNAKTDWFKLGNTSLWKGEYLYDLYARAHTPWDWHEELASYAKRVGITLFSTPFDESAVDFLEERLNPPAYKIASFEINHIPLLHRVGLTRKPVFLSTGMAQLEETREAVETLSRAGCPNVVLLKCVSNYPADPKDFNLRSLTLLSKKLRCPVGLSDHSLSHEIAMGAVALGACAIEKHIVMSRASSAVDSAFSLEPHEFKSMADMTERLYRGLGTTSIGPVEQEATELQYRRSIFIAADINKGELLNQSNLKIVRPADGLHPRRWWFVIGKRATRKLKFGNPLREEDFS